MSLYKDPIIKRLISIFEAEGPADLKGKYYYGDPLQVPESMLPAVFISRNATVVRGTTNAEDESEMDFTLDVVFDLKRDFGQAAHSVNSATTLWDSIEGRNDDYTLKPTSFVYLLRKYEVLGPRLWMALKDGVKPNYGVGVEVRGKGVFTVEGVVRFTVLHHQLRPGLDSGVPDELYASDGGDLYEAE